MLRCRQADIPQRNARIFERFQSGESTTTIARDYQTYRAHIDRIVNDVARKRGVARRPIVHADRIILDLSTTQGLQSGLLSRTQAAARLGCSRNLISQKLKEVGITAPKHYKGRKVKQLTARGETRYLVDWAQITGIRYDTLQKRLNYGWDAEKVLFTPVRERGKHDRRTS